MFVEIMGLQMNTERLNATPSSLLSSSSSSSHTTNTPNLFRYPDDVPHPPPPGGWPTGLPAVPGLEDIPPEDRAARRKTMAAASTTTTRGMAKSQRSSSSRPPPPPPQPVTGAAGIAVVQWYALERAAIEDALEQEERMRKMESSSGSGTPLHSSTHHANSNGMQSSPSSLNNNKHHQQLLQAEAASNSKKWIKAVAAWRAKVGTAVAQNDTDLLQHVLGNAPSEPPPTTHISTSSSSNNSTTTTSLLLWEPLVPLIVASKHARKDMPHANAEARWLLAQHIVQETATDEQQTSLLFTIHRTDGRSVVHSACLYADVPILQLVLESASRSCTAADLRSKLLEPCQDSGWTPLHYAALSGSIRTVETIFATVGSDDPQSIAALCHATTHPAQTWKKGRHHGATPTELAEAMLSGKTDKLIESHGIALQAIADHYKVPTAASSSSSSTATTQQQPMNLYMYLTGFLYCRILATETSGYTSLTESEIVATELDFVQRLEQHKRTSTTSAAAPSPAAADAATVAVENKQGNMTEEDEDDDNESTDGQQQQQQQAKKKKKKKKRKKKKGASVDSGPQQPTSSSVLSDDPLIGALLGMGFEYDQVMDGIEGCGGMSRATADDVVAWIFRQSEEEQEPPSAASSSAQASVTNPKNSSGGVTISQAESERLNAIKVQEDRIAAEKLAAKREEQRRRNREWNNRAQVRQAMEAQGKVAKVAAAARHTAAGSGALRTGAMAAGGAHPQQHLAGGTHHPHHQRGLGTAQQMSPLALGASANQLTPGDVQIARKPQPTATGTATSSSRLMGGVHLPTPKHHPVSETGPDTNIYSNNEASTVASSLEHFEVEVGGNDDATVSTMGSFPAVPAPAPALPPGFTSGAAAHDPPSSLHAPPQWDSQRPPLPSNHQMPHMSPPPAQATMTSLLAPPGIPESGPLLDRSDLGHGTQRSQSFSVPPMPNRMPAQRSYSGSVYPDNSGGSMLGPLPTANNEPLGGGLAGSSFLSDGFGANNHNRHSAPPSAPAGFGASLPLSSGGVPGLMGFGNDLVVGGAGSSPHLESAIIDSISTGNTAINASALWNEAPAGSSLLGSLIDGSAANNSHGAAVHSSETNGNPLFTSSSSFNSNDNNSGNNNNHPSWHPDRVLQQKPSGGGGGGSIW